MTIKWRSYYLKGSLTVRRYQNPEKSKYKEEKNKGYLAWRNESLMMADQV
jgi:hypothetical protein